MEKVPTISDNQIEKIKFEFGSATLKGEKYTENHDTHFIDQGHGVAGVFDGVGTKNNGAKAAEAAKSGAEKEITKGNPASPEDRCAGVLHAANESILEEVRKDTTLNSMASTGTVVTWTEDGTGAFASAGDTRLYIVRDTGEIEQITKDDVYDMVELLPPRFKDVITNALGHEDFTPNSGTFAFRKGDRLLILSDGIYKAINDEQIRDIVPTAFSAQELADDLVNVALHQEEKSDDKTAVVIFAK